MFHKWTLHLPPKPLFPIKTCRLISFPTYQYLRDGLKIRLTRLPCLTAILLSFPRLRNIETLSNLFRSVLLLSPGKCYFISAIMHPDVAIQAAGCQPLYQGDDVDASLHTKVGGRWPMCVWECGNLMVFVCVVLPVFHCVYNSVCVRPQQYSHTAIQKLQALNELR